MALADRHAARFQALVQERVPERVLAAGYVSAAGAAKASAFRGSTTGLIGQAIGARVERDARNAAGDAGFPPTTWLGVTPTRVYAFAADGAAVRDLVGAWDRHDVVVTKSEKVATTRLSLRFGAEGPCVRVEARKWGAGNHRLLQYLLYPALAD